jgi:hypothetical protein
LIGLRRTTPTVAAGEDISLARIGSNDLQSSSSGYTASYDSSSNRRPPSGNYGPSYTTVQLTFAEAIAKVVADEMTAGELFRQLPAELRKEIDARCMSAFKQEFSLISSEQKKMVFVALLSATDPKQRRKAAVTRVMVKAVAGVVVGLMLAGLIWAVSRGLSWNFGLTITASWGWWIGCPVGVMLFAVGIGILKKN